MRFDISDRVILTNMEKHPISNLSLESDKHNPLWGSPFQSIGTISDINPKFWYKIQVRWDNGEVNRYNEFHLTLYKQPNQLPEELFQL